MFSGGVGSWASAKRVAERHGTDALTLLFADTRMEDEDLYRFVDEAAADVGGEFVRIAEGRDPWEVFFAKRFLGNSRVDPCSRILKREFMRRWLEDHCDPDATTVHLGFDWQEIDRYHRARGYWEPWSVNAPLIERPIMSRRDAMAALDATGIRRPRLYELGFDHNNCGGFCVKAGQAHFAHLLHTMPDRYAYHEQREMDIRDFLDADVAIMRDRSGGNSRPLTMREFRERLEDEPELYDADEWGACSCLG
jgi:hypothetical protein